MVARIASPRDVYRLRTSRMVAQVSDGPAMYRPSTRKAQTVGCRLEDLEPAGPAGSMAQRRVIEGRIGLVDRAAAERS